MKMEENTKYRLSEITVNADELRRIKDELDEILAQGLALYRRIENLINQGTIIAKPNAKTHIEEADNQRARDTTI